ncbi:hypothetical protein Z043_114155 [Scleropages formosus]|uniref:Uncharacterized protein n=1 Tax=Scleropages formosus TaxID=113540 RepID=A0A0P7UGJ1_SCLFO|nr:hypothetical protein Z043_114155 [Scleropages formosus]
MEGSTTGSSFGIDSLLSHRPGSPIHPRGDSVGGDCGSPLELSPGSDAESSGCSSPPSPRRDCVEEAAQRAGRPLGLEAHVQHGQPRTVTSSFLIRDILADCKPLAACAPYSSNGQPTQEAERLASKIPDEFMEKMHSNSSSDSEYKGKSHSRPVGRSVAPASARQVPGECRRHTRCVRSPFYNIY